MEDDWIDQSFNDYDNTGNLLTDEGFGALSYGNLQLYEEEEEQEKEEEATRRSNWWHDNFLGETANGYKLFVDERSKVPVEFQGYVDICRGPPVEHGTVPSFVLGDEPLPKFYAETREIDQHISKQCGTEIHLYCALPNGNNALVRVGGFYPYFSLEESELLSLQIASERQKLLEAECLKQFSVSEQKREYLLGDFRQYNVHFELASKNISMDRLIQMLERCEPKYVNTIKQGMLQRCATLWKDRLTDEEVVKVIMERRMCMLLEQGAKRGIRDDEIFEKIKNETGLVVRVTSQMGRPYHVLRSVDGKRGKKIQFVDHETCFYQIYVAYPSLVPVLRDWCFDTYGGGNTIVAEADIPYTSRFSADVKKFGMNTTFSVDLDKCEFVGSTWDGMKCEFPYSDCCYELIVRDYKDLVFHKPEEHSDFDKVCPYTVLYQDDEMEGFDPQTKKLFMICGRVQYLKEMRIDKQFDIAFVMGDVNEIPEEHDIPLQVLSFQDEKDLLLKWSKFKCILSPWVISGHNVDNFDINWELERAKTLGIEKEFARFSRARNQTVRTHQREDTTRAHGKRITNYSDAKGIAIMCTLSIFSKKTSGIAAVCKYGALSSYSLNALAHSVLNQSKLDIDHSKTLEMMENKDDRTYVVKYCIRDVALVQQLVRVHGTLYNAIVNGRQMCVPGVDSLYRGMNFILKSILYRNMRKHHKVECRLFLETLDKRNFDMEILNDTYEGAKVFLPEDPFPEENIAVLDFASLYPSIMMQHNVCSTTLMSKEEALMRGYLEGIDYVDACEGLVCVTSKHRIGFFRNVEISLMNLRNIAKRQMGFHQKCVDRHVAIVYFLLDLIYEHPSNGGKKQFLKDLLDCNAITQPVFDSMSVQITDTYAASTVSGLCPVLRDMMDEPNVGEFFSNILPKLCRYTMLQHSDLVGALRREIEKTQKQLERAKINHQECKEELKKYTDGSKEKDDNYVERCIDEQSLFKPMIKAQNQLDALHFALDEYFQENPADGDVRELLMLFTTNIFPTALSGVQKYNAVQLSVKGRMNSFYGLTGCISPIVNKRVSHTITLVGQRYLNTVAEFVETHCNEENGYPLKGCKVYAGDTDSIMVALYMPSRFIKRGIEVAIIVGQRMADDATDHLLKTIYNIGNGEQDRKNRFVKLEFEKAYEIVCFLCATAKSTKEKMMISAVGTSNIRDYTRSTEKESKMTQDPNSSLAKPMDVDIPLSNKRCADPREDPVPTKRMKNQSAVTEDDNQEEEEEEVDIEEICCRAAARVEETEDDDSQKNVCVCSDYYDSTSKRKAERKRRVGITMKAVGTIKKNYFVRMRTDLVSDAQYMVRGGAAVKGDTPPFMREAVSKIQRSIVMVMYQMRRELLEKNGKTIASATFTDGVCTEAVCKNTILGRGEYSTITSRFINFNSDREHPDWVVFDVRNPGNNIDNFDRLDPMISLQDIQKLRAVENLHSCEMKPNTMFTTILNEEVTEVVHVDEAGGVWCYCFRDHKRWIRLHAQTHKEWLMPMSFKPHLHLRAETHYRKYVNERRHTNPMFAMGYARQKIEDLRNGKVAFEDCIQSVQLGKPIEEYATPVPASVAAKQAIRYFNKTMVPPVRVQIVMTQAPARSIMKNGIMGDTGIEHRICYPFYAIENNIQLDAERYITKFSQPILATFRGIYDDVEAKMLLFGIKKNRKIVQQSVLVNRHLSSLLKSRSCSGCKCALGKYSDYADFSNILRRILCPTCETRLKQGEDVLGSFRFRLEKMRQCRIKRNQAMNKCLFHCESEEQLIQHCSADSCKNIYPRRISDKEISLAFKDLSFMLTGTDDLQNLSDPRIFMHRGQNMINALQMYKIIDKDDLDEFKLWTSNQSRDHLLYNHKSDFNF